MLSATVNVSPDYATGQSAAVPETNMDKSENKRYNKCELING